MGCLANTKGILVMSSKSVTVLGLIAAGAAPLPLRPVAGVARPVSAKGAPPVAIVTCSTLSKNEIEINFVKILFFDNSRAG